MNYTEFLELASQAKLISARHGGVVQAPHICAWVESGLTLSQAEARARAKFAEQMDAARDAYRLRATRIEMAHLGL